MQSKAETGVAHFFYGTLRHQPLLEALMGHPLATKPAQLAGYSVHVALTQGGQAQSFPVLVAQPGAVAQGVVAFLGPEDTARLAFYELGYTPRVETVTCEDAAGGQTRLEAVVQTDPDARWRPGPLWDLHGWQQQWAAIALEALPEYMALMGQVTPEVAAQRYPMILVRADSRLRARAEAVPSVLRRREAPEDLAIETMTQRYVGFFAVEDYRVTHRLFAGGRSRPLPRAVFISGDAVAVLPYDPLRDRVLLVEQVRMGPMARGGGRDDWQIEAIAGRIDPGETPAAAALREAGEEAGVVLSDLLAGPRFYPSPGAVSEYIYTYVALADLPDGTGRPGGLAEEGEDIRPHLVSFSELMDLIDSSEVENGPLVILALWLARGRGGLMEAAKARLSPPERA